jgi:hypothetical protein
MRKVKIFRLKQKAEGEWRIANPGRKIKRAAQKGWLFSFNSLVLLFINKDLPDNLVLAVTDDQRIDP